MPSCAMHTVLDARVGVAKAQSEGGGSCVLGKDGVLANMAAKGFILAEGENAKIVVAALSHVAARLVRGFTFAMVLRRHTTTADGLFFPGEASLIPLSMQGGGQGGYRWATVVYQWAVSKASCSLLSRSTRHCVQ